MMATPTPNPSTSEAAAPRGLKRVTRWIWCWFRRFVLTVLTLVAAYSVIVVVGLIPVNNDFSSAESGIEVLIISNEVHADLILPMRHELRDWRTILPTQSFAGETDGATHVAIGWGDAGFYLHTPTWSDLKFSTAANALFWPSDSCMHVSMTRAEHYRSRARSVRLSTDQYALLIQFIDDSFDRNEQNEVVTIPGAYGNNDAFFEANGHYHALNTCNSWAGDALQSAGVRVPWLTPLPKSVYLYLPDEQ